jgi:hypothetical protein
MGIQWPVVYATALGVGVIFGGTALLRQGSGRRRDSAAWAIGLLSLSLFIAACTFPAVDFEDGHLGGDTVRFGAPTGLVALLLGWLPPFCIPWLANPIWLFGMIGLSRGKYWAACALGVAASLLGLTTLLFFSPMAGLTGFLLDGWSLKLWQRAGHAMLGFYLWQASLLALPMGAAVGLDRLYSSPVAGKATGDKTDGRLGDEVSPASG